MDDDLIKFEFSTGRSSIIKVIGVGGGGGNAVNHMYHEGIHDVTFVLCNTDSQALFKSDVPAKLQLGKTVTEGLGAGNRPEKARLAAEESSDDIWKFLDDGTKMVFITAGMGGGTGTGAAPVIARIAKSMEILTVGIVTIPFLFEGERKIIQALDGVERIAENVDALLVINNERLRDIYHDLDVPNAFQKADDTLTVAAKSIAEIITVPGYINLDFADVHTILKDGGVAIMSSGLGSGESRVSKAIENALNSPLLNNNDVFNAKKILLNISSSHESPLMMEEMTEVHNFMSRFDSDIEVIWGTAIDEGLKENVKITILATGFGMSHVPFMKERIEKEELAKRLDEMSRLEEEERRREENKKRIAKVYGESAFTNLNKRIRPKPFLFTTLEQMDDDSLIDIIVKYPAYNRDSKKMEKEIDQLDAKYTVLEEDEGNGKNDDGEQNNENLIQF
ncbi:MAG: cell division protein FtsZ [Dysgonamonadaceae bacterium]|jgi:cell division protein FtsZ|nr:cell division protein FtsZ [Dysgonamonadaceae bacterium]